MNRLHFWGVIVAVFLIIGCSTSMEKQFEQAYGPEQIVNREVNGSLQGVSFQKDVRPIIDRRCSACHSCYDAPCQLKLTSFEGLERGASKLVVYNGERLISDQPTRLFIDAHSARGWRHMEFHPLLNERNQTKNANLKNSVLAMMLNLKKEHPLPQTELLPQEFDLDLDKTNNCKKAEEFAEYKEKYPLWGMPYALPGLTEEEHDIILDWLQQGGKICCQSDMSPRAKRIVDQWESFFNGTSLKEQLVSRYIYEHLFIARIHFDSLPNREFYRLVRSKTPPGEPVAEINTTRPYDDPEVEQFYYRFKKIESTIVVKDHTVFLMNPEKMDRFRELFITPDYKVNKLPSYDPKTASNPIKTFVDLPAKSRYQFMLDNAQFIVMGFIKGPVCRGQIALNVINDHFFVAFVDPEKNLLSTDNAFLESVSDYLNLPAERENTLRISSIWYDYLRNQKKYLEAKDQFIESRIPDDKGNDITHVWDGDGQNDNALLTVFRHFDSATVVKGFVGQIPKTGWILDYPLFERIHYLLVAGFDVFGNVGHQAITRLYMDFLRMEAENNFLSFLPKDTRREIRSEWYQGTSAEFSNHIQNPLLGQDRETGIIFETNDPKKEFFEKILEHAGPAAKGHDYLNRCETDNCVDEASNDLEKRVERAFAPIPGILGNQVQVVPDVCFIHITTDRVENDMVYSVIRNKALSSNSFMFHEDRRRIPDHDYLTIVKGHLGSYPNAFCRVDIDQIETFVSKYRKINDKLSYYNFAGKYAIRRTSPDFWEEYDWHCQKFRKDQPIESGLFDLYRFDRIAEKNSNNQSFKW
ncbi:MAG: fatty acid cis/trans isomerase [Desulfobacteraceae bacterium]|nr:fatty acid cis/trans isomerase [Desulfobacteraceae bacterium]MBC2754887.1 fatty acid cis/trans isomerase [Desulfobacteraceae bacterium]